MTNYKDLRSFPLLFLSLSLFIVSCQTEKKPPAPSFRNVVVIVGDDHASTVLGAYGNPLIHTPNMDRLASEGTIFTNAYASSPLCSASRQSMLTGKYPHATGVNLLFTPFNDRTNTTIAEHLKEHDFATALIGKQHFNTWIWSDLFKGEMPTFGFDTLIDQRQYRTWLGHRDRRPIPDSVRTFSRENSALPLKIARMNAETLPQPYYQEDAKGTFLTEAAIEFINNHRDNRFFLWLAYNEPHAPFAFPIEFAGRYRAEDMPLPEGSPEDDRWVPERFQGFTDKQIKGVIASYYTSVEFLDDNIGRVLDAIQAKDLLEETLIVYLGDQGYLLYDHKRFEKHTMWAEAIKAPLIVSGGNHLPQGKKYEELIEFIDLAPFVSEAAGVPSMEDAQGKSFLSLLTENEYEEKGFVFAEFLEDNKAMVADKQWKYIFSTGKRDLGQGYETGLGAPGITHRLYNLQSDPGETTDVAHRDENQEVLATMKERMLQRFLDTHPYAHELPDNLTIDGKLVWFCEPRDVGAEFGGEPLRVFYPEE